MNPGRTRWVIVVVGLLAIAIAWLLRPPPLEEIEIRYAFTTDAADLLVPLIDEFNESGPTSDGRPVHVVPESREGISSGETQRRIAGGALEPVIWTPASSLWAGLLAANYGDPSAPGARSLAQSPQVVAMFNERHNQLTSAAQSGSVDPRPGLQDVLEEATTDPAFKFAHTDPNQSTSGLSMVLSEFHLASASNGNTLTLADVADGRDEVAGYEQSVAHYVDIARDFATLWCDEFGSEFADAAYMQETTYLALVRNPKCQGQFTALYPGDAPLVADYPYVILEGTWAKWVSPTERRAATVFGEWLEERLDADCRHIKESGLRRGDCIPADVPEHGRDLLAPPPTPEPPVLAEIKRLGTELRRAANVMLVVDQSVEMLGGGRFETLLSALQGAGIDGQDAFVNCLQQNDSVGMIVFGTPEADGPSESVPLARRGTLEGRVPLEEGIDDLDAGRGRATMYDAIDAALENQQMHSPDSINTVIVLTAGTDHGSAARLRDVEDAFYSGGIPPQVIAVAYDDRGLAPLRHLVKVSIGRFYEGDPADVAAVREFVCDFL